MLTISNIRHISWSNLNFSTSWSDPNFSTSWSDPNFNCLPQRQTTQLSAYMAQSQLPTPWTEFNFSTSWSDPNFNCLPQQQKTQLSVNFQLHGRNSTFQHHGRTPTSTVCHWVRQSNSLPPTSTVESQLTLFQNLQILRTIASEHDVIHTPVLFPIWGLLWQLWLSYLLRASVNYTQCLCTWTKNWMVQSPTKLNYKI